MKRFIFLCVTLLCVVLLASPRLTREIKMEESPRETEEPPTATEHPRETEKALTATEPPQPEEPLQTDVPELLPRYARLTFSDEDVELLAKVVALEAGGESARGQQAVAEVILNRVLNSAFPDTVSGVIFDEGQFETAQFVDLAEPSGAQYDAVEAALYGPSILPAGVVYFSSVKPENSFVWGEIGNHVFCYEYYW